MTGESHRGAKLHGFMYYLIKCAVNKLSYEVYGYKGKQVRDNLHADDVAKLIYKIIVQKESDLLSYPIVANLGGGRDNSISILELIQLLKDDFSLSLDHTFNPHAREGDHQWYITDNSVLQKTDKWQPSITVRDIVESIVVAF